MRDSTTRGEARAMVWLAALALAATIGGCALVAGVDFDAVTARVAADGGAGGSVGGGDVGGGGGQGGDGAAGGGGGPPPCDPAEAALDAEGCACDSLGATKSCWLGDPGPLSACNTGGVQQCGGGGSLAWGSCSGAAPPGDELCYDGIDGDCDGELDQGCACSASVDLCVGGGGQLPSGDNLLLPPSVKLGANFDLFLVSTLPVPNTRLQINDSYCAGGANASDCAAGAGCPGWYAMHQVVTASSPPFSVGQAKLTVLIDDPGPPCDGDQARSIVGYVDVVP